MIEFNVSELKAFMGRSVQEVFDTMLSMPLDPLDEMPDLSSSEERMVGSVGFAGKVLGCVNLHVPCAYARLIAGDMLGVEPDELDGPEEIQDVIGEISNMIGGGIKSRLCDSGYPCELSIPSITSGKDFAVESKGWAIREAFPFSYRNHSAFVEVFLKPVH